MTLSKLTFFFMETSLYCNSGDETSEGSNSEVNPNLLHTIEQRSVIKIKDLEKESDENDLIINFENQINSMLTLMSQKKMRVCSK